MNIYSDIDGQTDIKFEPVELFNAIKQICDEAVVQWDLEQHEFPQAPDVWANRIRNTNAPFCSLAIYHATLNKIVTRVAELYWGGRLICAWNGHTWVWRDLPNPKSMVVRDNELGSTFLDRAYGYPRSRVR